jgi:hypothetical protein
MPADGKGARGNDVMTKTHATGSAVSYGMRYLLKMIFNVSSGEADDDGNAASRRDRRPPPLPAPNVMRSAPPAAPDFDPQTGEIIDSPPAPPAATTAPSDQATQPDGAVSDEEAEYDRLKQLDVRLAEAAEKGVAALQTLWMTLSKEDRHGLKAALDRRHKVRATEVDAERA